MPEDIQIQECPHDDDLDIQPRADTIIRLEDGEEDCVTGWGRSVVPFRCYTYAGAASRYTSVGSLASGSGLGRGHPRGRCFRAEAPYATTYRRRPIDLPEVAGKDGPALLAGAALRAGVMKFDGPAGRSSHAEKTREPLQLMVHAQTDPAGQFSAS